MLPAGAGGAALARKPAASTNRAQIKIIILASFMMVVAIGLIEGMLRQPFYATTVDLPPVETPPVEASPQLAPQSPAQSSEDLTTCLANCEESATVPATAVADPAYKPRVYAVFATDTVDPKYASTAPLSSYVWSVHVGITPILLLVLDSSELTSFQKALVETTAENGGHVVYLTPRERDLTATTLQVGRLATWALPFLRDEDVLVTCDSDIWPLNAKFWKNKIQGILDDRYDFFVFNGPFFRSQQRMGSKDFAALSFLMTKVGKWRAMYMKLFGPPSIPGARFDIHTVLHRMLDRGRDEAPAAWDGHLPTVQVGHQWSWDQVLAGQMLVASNLCPNRCDLNMHVQRLDRSDWVIRRPIQEYTEAHMVYPLTDDGAWPSVIPVWKDLFGNTTAADRIRAKLQAARKVN